MFAVNFPPIPERLLDPFPTTIGKNKRTNRQTQEQRRTGLFHATQPRKGKQRVMPQVRTVANYTDAHRSLLLSSFPTTV